MPPSSNKRNIPTIWVADLTTQEEIEDFKARLINLLNTDIGTKLISILNRELSAYSAAEVKIETYDTPSWGYRQAHMNGGRQALLKVLKLLGEEV